MYFKSERIFVNLVTKYIVIEQREPNREQRYGVSLEKANE